MVGVRRAIAFSAADKYASQLLQVVTLAIMSRLLTPAEIGTYMIASTIFVLADNLRTFGVGVYLVQVPVLDRTLLRSAFTVTLVLSLLTICALTALAEPLARFYGASDLGRLVSLSAAAFFFVPFTSPIVALLQRAMAFRALAVLNLIAAGVNFTITVCLALAGFGPASYIWGFIAQSLAQAIVALALHPELAIFRLSTHKLREILAFGLTSSATTFVNMGYDLLPRLAFGKILGFDAVGLFGRAQTICQIPDRAITSALQPVVLPAMAAHARAGGDLKAAWLRGHALMSAIQWPTLLMIALLAEPVVALLLGAQWTEAVPLVRLISIATMALAPAFMTFPLLIAAGRIRDTLLASLISLPPSVLVVVGAAWLGGLTAAAASLLIVAPWQMLVALAFVHRAVGLTATEVIAASRASAYVAIGTAIAPVSIILYSPTGFALGWGATSLAVATAGVGWFATLHLLKHPIRDEILAAGRMIVAASAP